MMILRIGNNNDPNSDGNNNNNNNNNNNFTATTKTTTTITSHQVIRFKININMARHGRIALTAGLLAVGRSIQVEKLRRQVALAKAKALSRNRINTTYLIYHISSYNQYTVYDMVGSI